MKKATSLLLVKPMPNRYLDKSGNSSMMNAETKTIPINPKDIKVGDKISDSTYGYLTVEKVIAPNPEYREHTSH